MSPEWNAPALARALQSVWGSRASESEMSVATSEASANLYAAAQIHVADTRGGVQVDVETAIPSLPVREREEWIPADRLLDTLREVDAEIRAQLPARFVHAFDDWATRGAPFSALPDLHRHPGPRLALSEVATGVERFWGSSVSKVELSHLGETRVTASIYDRLPVSFSFGTRHGELNAGVLIKGGLLTHCFGTWLIADHPDEAGLERLCRVIDEWATLRLGTTPVGMG